MSSLDRAMSRTRRRLRRAVAFYCSHALLSTLLLAWVVPFGEWSLRVPFDNWGDSLFLSTLVKAVAEDGPIHASRVGAPFGSDIVDWPLGMWLSLGFTGAFVALFRDAGIAVNLFWLVSLVAAGLTATWSLVRLSLPSPVAFVFGMLYAFIPFGLYWNTAGINMVFSLVPLVALLALRVAGTHPSRGSPHERWVLLGACLAQGLTYVYYAFFGCILLAVAVPIGWLRTRQSQLVRLAGVGMLFLIVGTAIPLAPSFAYWARNGRNPALAYKAPAEADHHGLKIRDLLMPRVDHPIGPLRTVATRIKDAQFPNDNPGASLGTLGGLGFMALVGLALARASGAFRFDEDLGPASALLLGGLLVAQVGGLGSVFNALISPDIRAYNRISVFIAFFSLYASAVLARRAFGILPPVVRMRRSSAVGGLALLLGFGIIDQTPLAAMKATRSRTAPAFAEVDAFVSSLEKRLAPGSMVFQLPHQTIPVDRRRKQAWYLYEPGRAFLSSQSLRWSWGSIAGRDGEWQTLTSRLTPARLVRTVALAGFSGIWVDRHGYEANPQQESFEAGLVEAAAGWTVVSSRGRYVFIDTEGFQRRLEATRSAEELARERAAALTPSFRVRWVEGCAKEQQTLHSIRRVCGPSSRALIRNPLLQVARVHAKGEFRSARPGRLTIRVGQSSETLDIGSRPVRYESDVTIGAGRPLQLDLSHDGPCALDDEPHCLEIIDFVALWIDE